MLNRRRLSTLLTLILCFTVIPFWAPTDTLPTAEATLVPLDFGQHKRGRVVESTPVTASFAMAGLSWQGEAPQEAWVRYKVQGRHWSPWQPLEMEPDTQADPGSTDAVRERPASEPLWTGPADQIQYRIRLADPSTQFKAALVDPSTPNRSPIQRLLDQFDISLPPAGATHPNPLSIRSRASWDPNNKCRPEDPADPAYTQVSMAFVHHTTTTNGYTESQVPNLILAICKYHVNVRGWNDIGYNFIVDRFGGIWEARGGGIDRGVIGAHTGGFNSYSFGVGLLGDHRVAPLSSSAKAALIDLLTWKLAIHNVPGSGTITLVSKGSSKYEQGTRVKFNRIAGHRDASSTTCPGYAAYQQLGAIRTAVSNRWSPLPAGSYRHNLAGSFTGGARIDGASFRKSDASWWVVSDLGPRKWAEFPAKSGWAAQVPGDFNGDGRDDIANFNVKNGTWWVSISTGDRFVTRKWAEFPAKSGWISQVVGDYDGDGRDDIANFNIKNGTWWVSISTGDQFVTRKWADFTTATGWRARLVGDFNKDGRADIAQYHPKNNSWWTSLSNGKSFTTKFWGAPAPRDRWSLFTIIDLNGDNRDDVAVIDSYDGAWWVGASDGTAFRFKQRADGIWRHLFRGVGVDGNQTSEVAYFNAQEFVWSRATTTGDQIAIEELGVLPHP